MDVPMLSQDEFFRHLNLRSVHATAAKYHYRQALKERLRASSQKLAPNSNNDQETKSPVVTPVKWLSPNTCRRLFGRPHVRTEKRSLDFTKSLKSEVEEAIICGFSDNDEKKSILEPLLNNCHVLRHPGIKRELELKVSSGIKLEDEILLAQHNSLSSCIEERKCYYYNGNHGKLKKVEEKVHHVNFRVQPGLKNFDDCAKKERKMAAALSLYHNHKPRGHNMSFSDFMKLIANSSDRRLPPMINGYHSSSRTQHSCAKKKEEADVEKKVTLKPPPPQHPPAQFRTAFGRTVKPVLTPVTNNTHVKNHLSQYKCDGCGHKFSAEKLSKSLCCKRCQSLKKKVGGGGPPAAAFKNIVEVKPRPQFKCDICSRNFGKRSRMIKHITSFHPGDIHKVDLTKFVSFKNLAATTALLC